MIDTTGTIRYFNRSQEDYLVVLGFMGDCWSTDAASCVVDGKRTRLCETCIEQVEDMGYKVEAKV
jgi:hypothetical protein